MNYGFNIGAAGVISSMHRQDVAANNLANIETVGYKPDVSTTVPREAERIESGMLSIPSNKMLERLGGGLFLAPTRTSFSQGIVNKSGNPLDIAIRGNGFLAVSAPGSDGQDGPRLTRDGRLTMDQQGRLITVTGGRPVLDTQGRRITLDPTLGVDIQSDGTISQGGASIAKLQFLDGSQAQRLNFKKLGSNLFEAPPATLASLKPADGTIVQYATEQSASDPIQAMMAVQNAANAVGTNVKIMQIHDELMSRAINGLGRVTG